MGAELLRGLTLILRAQVQDPRLGEITLQEVRVSRDLSHAKVYFTCFPDDADAAAQQRLLNGPLAGFLRARLGQAVPLRSMPQLHFVHDPSIREGERLAALIEQANRPDATNPDVSSDAEMTDETNTDGATSDEAEHLTRSEAGTDRHQQAADSRIQDAHSTAAESVDDARVDDQSVTAGP